MVKGVKRGGGGSGEVITNGSGIVVNEGQCALIVEDGNILEVAAEPGNYTFDSSLSPSVFDGGFKGIKDTFNDMIGRFTFGGNVNKSQRVYYVNTKEIYGNKYGTSTPIPFRVMIDKNKSIDVDVALRCNGEYSFFIVNPLTFFKKVAGNVKDVFYTSQLDDTMKSEMLDALVPSVGKISQEDIRYSDLPLYTGQLKSAIASLVNERWEKERGINFGNITINSVTIPDADAEKLKNIQFAAVNKDKETANATIITATADALRDAANNPNGAAVGMMNIGMVTNTASHMLQDTGKELEPVNEYGFCPHCGHSLAKEGKYCPFCGKEI